jgi:hypothetical protein
VVLHGQPGDVTAPFIENVLSYQLPGGAFSPVSPNSANKRREDIDLTAMAVTALAPYTGDGDVQSAIDGALTFLSAAQEEDGGYSSFGKSNAESVSQVIIALCAAGVALDDPRFVKNGNSALDALLGFKLKDGSFSHDKISGKANPIATYQAALALTAINKAASHEEAGAAWLFK